MLSRRLCWCCHSGKLKNATFLRRFLNFYDSVDGAPKFRRVCCHFHEDHKKKNFLNYSICSQTCLFNGVFPCSFLPNVRSSTAGSVIFTLTVEPSLCTSLLSWGSEQKVQPSGSSFLDGGGSRALRPMPSRELIHSNYIRWDPLHVYLSLRIYLSLNQNVRLF